MPDSYSFTVTDKNQPQLSYHTLSAEQTIQALATSSSGLNQAEVARRLQQYGHNQLASSKKRDLFMKFVDQFKDLMIIILLVAALLSFITQGVTDAIIILAVVILNAMFGVYQESRAEVAIEALKSMSSPIAKVQRDGQVRQVNANELVIGDVVILEAGDVVPADMRLLESNSLKIEQAALTGESVPVEKFFDITVAEDAGIGDRVNMAYQNANVSYGRGVGIVTHTGMFTEVGHIASLIAKADETDTPLKQSLNQLSKILTYMVLIIAVATFMIGVLWRGQAPLDGLMTSVALAVAAIPEGLPAIVTVVLSIGTQVLSKRNAIIRNLPAVETLGSTEIIASDKTGTLTMNQMIVEKLYYHGEILPASVSLDVHNNALRVMSFANDTRIDASGKLLGDPTETALVQYALDHQFDIREWIQQQPRVAELPFDSVRKLMTTIHQLPDGQFFIAVKGAPDQLLKRIDKVEQADGIRSLTDADTQSILATNQALARQALRVLMMAYKISPSMPVLDSDTLENGLIFVALVGMIDPERPEAAEAVRVAKKAGIRPIMITGDHQDTAQAIAKRLGIIDANNNDKHVLTGTELNEMSDSQFNQVFKNYSVYARVSPEHKVRIVSAWQKDGKVVAMTGDGVNDAPSLKQADIGIGMGITGTEVSKSASDMVLADDNFATIIKAVKEGRKVFSNIQKTIQYLLSANMAEVLIIFLATLFGWDVLKPVHLLWLNLVTDTLPAIALGVEPAEKDSMNRPPRGRNSSFFSGGVLNAIIYQGVLQTILVLGVYAIALQFPQHKSHADIHADALTMAYVTLGLIQLVHAYNVKSVYQSVFRVGLFKNQLFNWAIVMAFILMMMTVVVPGFNQFFHVTQLNAPQWGIVIGGSLMMLVLVEIIKLVQRQIGAHKRAI